MRPKIEPGISQEKLFLYLDILEVKYRIEETYLGICFICFKVKDLEKIKPFLKNIEIVTIDNPQKGLRSQECWFSTARERIIINSLIYENSSINCRTI